MRLFVMFFINMKRFFPLILLTFLICSCSPKISVKALSNGAVDVSFGTGFSKATGETLRKIADIPSDSPIFSPNDMTSFLVNAGATNVSASTPSALEVEASGRLFAEKNALSATKILSRTESSVSLTLGPEQIRSLYALLDEDTKSYFDMMMIPALAEETLELDEYRMILAAMYGQKFANELIDGVVLLELSSPDGKKTERISEKLGVILTLTKEKTWKLDF